MGDFHAPWLDDGRGMKTPSAVWFAPFRIGGSVAIFESMPPRPEDNGRLRVAIGSDDPLTRHGFAAALDAAPDIEIAATGTIAEVAAGVEASAPEVVVLDVQVAATEGLLAVAQVRGAAPRVPVLAFCSPAGSEFGVLCIEAGASGYLSKEIDLDVLPRVLHGLRRGEAAVSRRFAGVLVERLRAHQRRSPRLHGTVITEPERRVLEHVQAAETPEEVADHLGLSVTTVRRHLSRARRKVTASGRAGGAAMVGE